MGLTTWRASLRPLFAATVAAACLAGCGGRAKDEPVRAAAQGTVRIGSEPLHSGVIRFIPVMPSQGPTAAAPIKDGMFEIPAKSGPVVGSHRIEIDGLDYAGFAPDDEQAYAEWEKKGKPPLPRNPVPRLYAQERSPLQATVKQEGENKFEFTLDPKAALAVR